MRLLESFHNAAFRYYTAPAPPHLPISSPSGGTLPPSVTRVTSPLVIRGIRLVKWDLSGASSLPHEGVRVTQETLSNLLQENRRFAPPQELAASANVTQDAYDEAG